MSDSSGTVNHQMAREKKWLEKTATCDGKNTIDTNVVKV